MRARTWILAAVVLLAAASFAFAAPTYVGADKCKMCHKAQYDSWQQTAHAKATDLLKGDDATKAECLKCHATGGSAEMKGVQCEACHGPGSDYKSMKVMKDKDAAIAAGLILPDEKTCLGCHTGAPHEQPKFNYEEARAKGLHVMKK